MTDNKSSIKFREHKKSKILECENQRLSQLVEEQIARVSFVHDDIISEIEHNQSYRRLRNEIENLEVRVKELETNENLLKNQIEIIKERHEEEKKYLNDRINNLKTAKQATIGIISKLIQEIMRFRDKFNLTDDTLTKNFITNISSISNSDEFILMNYFNNSSMNENNEGDIILKNWLSIPKERVSKHSWMNLFSVLKENKILFYKLSINNYELEEPYLVIDLEKVYHVRSVTLADLAKCEYSDVDKIFQLVFQNGALGGSDISNLYNCESNLRSQNAIKTVVDSKNNKSSANDLKTQREFRHSCSEKFIFHSKNFQVN
jgi:hypothetical protein